MPGTYKYNDDGDTPNERLSLPWLEKELLGNFEVMRKEIPSIALTSLSSVKTVMNKRPIFEVLDVGCGNGRFRSLFPQDINYTGIDPDVMIDGRFDKEENPNISYYPQRFEEFKTDTKFDIILFIGSFYLMENYKLALEKARDLLDSEGKIIIVDEVWRDSFEKWIQDKEGHYFIQTLAEAWKLRQTKRIITSDGWAFISELQR